MEKLPQLFAFLLQEHCSSPGDIHHTPDGCFALYKPLSEIFACKGIACLPALDGRMLPCHRFFDDWYLYAVPHQQDVVYSLFKLREQEQDAREAMPADGDSPGVTVSFIPLQTDILYTCLGEPTEHHQKLLYRQLHQVVAEDGQTHHPALKKYFQNPKAQGAYMLARLYTKKLAATAANGIVPMPAACKDSPCLDMLNQAAGQTVCDRRAIYIQAATCLTQWEEAALLLTHTGCPSIYAFAAEVEYHARFLSFPAWLRIPFIGVSPYASALRADLSIGDAEWEGPAPYRRENSPIVRRHRRLHPEEK